jgi:3-hydroxyisobutyrate dehydrogenase
MSESTPTVGWIGIGRMGYPMVERLINAGNKAEIWNRTKSKAEPLVALGATIRDKPADLASVDILFTMVSTGADLDQVYFGENGVASGGKGNVPRIFVDCSSISVEESEEIRAKLSDLGASFISAPVSGNGATVKIGKLSCVASGPQAAFDEVKPLLATFAVRGVAYVGEGELARICKIAHNVMLGVVIQNLAEITILTNKAGVPRHAFLEFMNNGVMGSIFTQYKSNAFANLDFTTTFTPKLLRKDLDLGLEAGRNLDVPMPVTSATREALQAHFGAATLKDDPEGYLAEDFAAVIETVALAAGIELEPEGVPVPTGLEVPED